MQNHKYKKEFYFVVLFYNFQLNHDYSYEPAFSFSKNNKKIFYKNIFIFVIKFNLKKKVKEKFKILNKKLKE